MSIWNRLFADHPASIDETYGQHLVQALGFGVRMIWGGLQCIVHALVPGLCVTSGSEMISELHERMVTHRRRVASSRVLPMEARKAA